MKEGPRLITALLFQAGLIPLALFLGWLVGVDPLQALGGDWRAWAAGILATLPMLVLFVGLLRSDVYWAEQIHERLRMVIPLLFKNSPYLGVAAASILAGVGEELLFRGVIQEGIEQAASPAAGLVLSSIIFGILHWITPAYALLATGLGFYLGGLYMMTGTLIVPIVAHAVYDFFALRYYLVYIADEESDGDGGESAPEGQSDTEATPADEDASGEGKTDGMA